MPSRQDLTSKLTKARQQLQKAQSRVAELETQLFEEQPNLAQLDTREDRHAFDNLLEGCQIIGFDWRYVYVSNTVAHHGHHTKHKLIGSTMMEQYPGIEETPMFATLQRSMQERSVERIENEVQYPDAGSAWFELLVQPVPEGILILSQDITERKNVEEALRSSEEMASSAFYGGPAALTVTRTADGKFIDANQRFCEMFEFSRDEVIGHTSTELKLWTSEEGQKLTQQQREEGGLHNFEVTARSKSGRPIHLLVSLKEMRLYGDTCHITTMIDITEHKLVEKALQQTGIRFQSLVEAVEDYAIYLLDTSGNVVSWNTGAERLKGYRSDEIIGQHFSRLFTPEDQQSDKPNQLLSTVTVEGRAEDEGWRVRKDGSRFWANVVITALRNPDGSLYGFAKITRDLTQRKRAEENIRKLHRTLSVLSDINQAIVRIRHLPSLFKKACEIAVEKGDFRMAWIGLFDSNTGDIDLVTHAGIADNDLEKLIGTLNTQPLIGSLRAGERLVCNDIQNDPIWLTWREEASRLRCNSTVVLPLVVAGEIRGIFNLHIGETDFFDEQEMQLIDEMAGDVSFAIEVAEQDEQRQQAEAAVKRYAERMKILHEIDLGLIEATSIEGIFDAALLHIRSLFACQQAIAVLFDYATNEAIVYAVDQNYPSIMQKGGRFPAALDRIETFGLKAVMTFDDLDLLPDSYENLQRLKREGMRSALLAQLTIQGHQVGLLSLNADTVGFFTAEHREIAAEISRQLAIAIHQMHLSAEIEQHTMLLEQKVIERTADLQAALGRVEAILNNSPDGILLANADLTIQQTNSSFNTLFSSEWDAYFGKSLLTLFHSDDASKLSDLPQVAATQNGRPIEAHAVRKDGTTFDAELSIGVIKGGSLVCIIRNITERKAQERQLHYYASVQESVHDAVMTMDMHYRIQGWNQAAERIYGWKAEEVVGRNVLHEILKAPPEAEEERQRILQDFNRSGSREAEIVRPRKDGTTLNILASMTLLKDAQGIPFGIVAVHHDITERKAQERELRYHASLQESVSDAVIATDMDFRIQSWNRAAEMIYGWSAAEAIGKSANEILQTTYESEEDRVRTLHNFLERGAWQGEVIQRHRDGSEINVLASVNLFKDDLGQPFGVVSVNRDITQRKQVEVALQKSSAEIHDLYNNAPCGYHSVDKEGMIVQINDTELSWLGYTRDEVVGKLKITALLTPESLLVFHKTFPIFMEQGWINDVELDVVRKDGSIVHILLNATAIYDDDDQYLKSRSTLFNITALQQAQQAIIESEARYRLLAENISDVITKTNTDGIRTFITPSCYSLLGYTPDELVGQSSIELVYPDDRPNTLAAVMQAVSEGKTTFSFVQRFCHKSGHTVWVEVTNNIIYDPDTENPVEIIGVIRDITERKKAEESLRASEGRYRLLAENIADVIMTFSLDRLITYMSPSCERLLGYLPEEVEGKSHSEFIHPEDYPQVINRTRQAVVSKENFYTNQFRLRHKVGHYIWYEVRTRIIFDSTSGSVVQFISVLRDITERKRAEDGLRESEGRFRRAILDAPFPIMIHAEGGEVLHISNTWTEISGYSHAEIPTMTDWVKKAYRENSQTLRPLIEKVYALTEAQRGGEFRIWTKSGEERIWDFISAPLALMPDGRRMVSSMAMDITERKHAEEAIQIKVEEEHQFQSQLKALHEIIIELTGVDELDAFYKRAVELGRERLGFERLAMFLYDEQNDSAIGTFGTDTQGNLTDEREVRFTPDPNGVMQRSFERAERFYFNEQTTLYNAEVPVGHGWNVAAVLWNGTQSLGWFVADNLLNHTPASKSLLDIIGLYALSVGTLLAQKQTQLALRESESLHRLLAENINDLIMRSTLMSECLYISPSVQTILGYAPEELIGQPTFELIHPDDKATIWEAYVPALERNDPIMPHEYRARCKDGQYIWLETVGKPLVRDGTKEVYGVITSSRNITERKQTQDALRESEEKFRLLLDAAPVATVISDQKGRINVVNVQAETLFGYGRSELIGQMVEVLVPEYARGRHSHNRTTYIAAPRVRPMGLDMELFARHKNGSDIPVEIQLSYIETPDGIMVISFILDITERKRIAAELEQQRSFLRNMIDVSPSMIFVKDYDGRFVLANPSIANIYNTTIDALIGKTDADFNPTRQEVDDFLAADRMVITSGKLLFTEEPITNSIGKTHWLQTTKVPIVSADGKSKYVMGVSTDITERKEAEEALRESEEKYRFLVETMRGGLAVFDTEFRVIYINDRFCELMGYSREEVIGKQPVDFVDAANSPLVQWHLERRQNAESTTYEVPLLRKDGRQIHVLVSGSPLLDKQGKYNGSIVVVTDISIQKQGEETLRQALAKEKELGDLKTRFVSMASHEFRTPLATILALVETLSAYRHKLPEEQIEQRFDKIKDQVRHLKDIMEDVLMLARMQARRVEFNPVKLDLDTLARSVLDEFESRVDVKCRLEYAVSEGSHEVVLDRKLMRQIINNLVSNAIKYSLEGNVVRVYLECANSEVILKISDEGIGIPEADLPHLFEPFHRAANVGAISGTGLGLVITKEAVDLHGGTIAVESQQGVGTTFMIRIPIYTGGGQENDENTGD